FSNDARLTGEEKQQLLDWVAAGAPQGDPAQLPEPVRFVEGWQIPQPHRVIKMADRPYLVPATGTGPYQYFVVDPGFTEDMYGQAAYGGQENRPVVHHIFFLVAPPGHGRGAGKLKSVGDWLSATAPGAEPLLLPTGLAKRSPAGSKLIFQM